MKHFNEDTRVKFPATIQFLRLGYQYQSLKNTEIDFDTRIFKERFRNAIDKFNNVNLSDDELELVLIDINRAIKNNDLGREFYNWLVDPKDRYKLIDFDNIQNNDFAIVDELPFNVKEGTEQGSFRPDINILINGIPLAFLEVKKPNNDGGIQKEFNRMINQRLVNDEWKKFFNLIQFVSFSNNMEYEDYDSDLADEIKAGSFYTTPNGTSTSFSFFREDDLKYHQNYPYVDIDEETIKYVVQDGGYNPNETDTAEFKTNLSVYSPCNRFVTSVFDKERFMYFLNYGIMYLTETKKIKDKTTGKEIEMPIKQKHIMRYPQFFATRKIIERLEKGGKGGIIWHTQGSGKTALSAFSNKVLREYYAKQGITARFFFIVDRLDLMRQATQEFKNRHFNVINCSNKAELTKELNTPLPMTSEDCIGDVVVVNTHKIVDNSKMPQAKNDYGARIQRIFFIDEAHRSYSQHGEFYKNLMTCDLNGVYIAMTGTPILTKKERSNLKFGDYIHKYFYDKSIADGYTLRIKKENIDTVAQSEIRRNLDLESHDLNDKEVYESNDYINALCPFIENDFRNFRFTNTDNTIGGMVVCRSNPQAKMVQEWFEKNSKLTTGLVISDEGNPIQDQLNKNNQIDFRESLTPDMLIVNYMLTTGYDVKRLKKMYLLRGPHAQSLLQTISRVNRPYKSPTGKVYQYGYIVDFVDIEQEYNRTLEAYIKELENELNENGENEGSLTGLIIDKDDIKKKYDKYMNELLSIISIDDVEMFSKHLAFYNKDALLKIRRILRGIKDCETEFILSRAIDYADEIDSEKIKNLLKSTQERIDFVNLSNQPVSVLDIMNNDEVVNVIYQFIKTKIIILNLGDFAVTDEEANEFTKAVNELQNQIKKNINKQDIKIIKLEEVLRSIFNKLSISELDDLNELTLELKAAITEAKKINDENERLSTIYGGNYAFVKSYTDSIVNTTADKSEIEKLLVLIYESIKDGLNSNAIAVQGRKGFVDAVKKNVTAKLFKEKLYSKLKDVYTDIISDLYTNIQLFK